MQSRNYQPMVHISHLELIVRRNYSGYSHVTTFKNKLTQVE